MMLHNSSASQSNRRFGAATLLVLAAGLLAGCETSGGPSNPVSELVAYSSGARASAQAGPQAAARPSARQEAAKPPETPTTRAQAAKLCWGMAEKTHAGASLETRADIVNKCIDSKLNTADAGAGAKAEAKPEARAGAKPNAKPEAKPSAKPDAKPETATAPKPRQSADAKQAP